MTEKNCLIIGMMSGTSVDGIDAALVNFKSVNQFEIIHSEFTPYPKTLAKQVNQVALSKKTLSQTVTAELDQQLALLYAQASLDLLSKSGCQTEQISAIANHGQTVRHCPDAKPPFSMQLGNPQVIANLTKIKTIAQFRQADLALGGQGAPLMPAFHYSLIGERTEKPAYILNIGGIANLTKIGEQTIGFDTGPGNTLMDQWILKNRGENYDRNGDWAASGKPISTLLERLLQDPYFKLHYPKSTGTDYFNLQWLEQHYPNIHNHASKDIQATLLELSCQSIINEIKRFTDSDGDLYLCGGGAHNKALCKRLKRALPNFSVSMMDQLGVPVDWVEAVGFAWLGYCYLQTIPSNMPSVTGARKAVTLGKQYLPDRH